MKRRKGLACSSPLGTDSQLRQELEGDIYNIFPFLRDPNPEKRAFPMDRAFTIFGIFESTFYPISEIQAVAQQKVSGRLYHEVGHYLLGSALVTCEERALGARLLGRLWHFLLDADGDAKLLIPSFTIVGSTGKIFVSLQKLADQREQLFEAKHAVHEIIACTIQVDIEGWDRDKVKRLIGQYVGGDLLDEKVMDNFLDVYESLGPVGACSLGHYALNVIGLTQQTALERFEHAIKVASALNPDRYAHAGMLKNCHAPCPTARLMGYLRFIKHLDSNLPDYSMACCPLAGACFPSKLDSSAEFLTSRSSEDGNPVPSYGESVAATIYHNSACMMRMSGCDREEQLTQGNNLLPASVHEFLSWCDPFALSPVDPQWQGETYRTSILAPMSLIEHDNCDYKYTVGHLFLEREKPLCEISEAMFMFIALEASLQQMTLGEGPLCLCYPHQPANCLYRPLLQALWDCTEPDPEWENNWKKPEKKPPCIA